MSKKKPKTNALTFSQLQVGDVFRFGKTLRGGDTIWVKSMLGCVGIHGPNKGSSMSIPDQPVVRYKIIPRKKKSKE